MTTTLSSQTQTDSNTVINSKKAMTTKNLLWLELLALFLFTPVLLALDIQLAVKLCCVLVALSYCVVISRRQGLFVKSYLIGQNWRHFTKGMALRLVAFIVGSSLLVGYFLPESLFVVVLEKPLMWIAVSIFYAVFSVYPQEFLYRVFFFKRYRHLFSNPYLFIFINACLFSLAHTFLLNNLVFLLTFVGGILFALNYKKSQSLIAVSIEHSAYGLWLFTVGLGQQLAFPGG